MTGFAASGLIALPAALAVMLGADLGTTLAVQALSVDVGALMPLLLIAGVAVARLAERPRIAEVGRLLVGLGLILLALRLVAAASAPMRDSEVTALVLARLAHDPLLALVIAALLTWMMHSSVAFVLFVVSLAAGGLVGLPLALTLVLGANVGGGLIAVGLAPRAPIAARRVLYGNLGFRLAGAAVAFLLLGPVTGLVERLGSDPGRQQRTSTRSSTSRSAIVFLPLAGRAAALLELLLPTSRSGTAGAPPRLEHLDPALLDRPALALNAATRAMLQLADKVELMLREAMRTFEESDGERIARVEALEEEVDAEQEQIKLYLAQLMQRQLGAEESARVLEAILFTTNLEHIGDIIDKGLLPLAAKKQRRRLQFSRDGWRDIRDFHELIAEQMRRARRRLRVARRRGGARARRPEGSPARRGSPCGRAPHRPPARRAARDDRDQRAAPRRAARPQADQRPPDDGRLPDPRSRPGSSAARACARRTRGPRACCRESGGPRRDAYLYQRPLGLTFATSPRHGLRLPWLARHLRAGDAVTVARRRGTSRRLAPLVLLRLNRALLPLAAGLR